jgi:alpha-beta hydrolase superfamily lysophospholipase
MQSNNIVIGMSELRGELHSTPGAKQLIVICHGYRSSSTNETLVAITKGLNAYGYNTFTFNFSPNIGGFDIAQQVEDITDIVHHFKAYDSVILLAASFAALPAAIATNTMPKVQGLITLNGFFGLHWLGREHRKNYLKFRIAALVVPKYHRILRYYKRHLQPGNITVPVLVFGALHDQSVAVRQSQYFFDRLRSKRQFISLETADHGITRPQDRAAVIADLHLWLDVTYSTLPGYTNI